MIWLQEKEEALHRIPLPDYGDFRPETLKIPLLAALEQEDVPAVPECDHLRGGPFRQARPCLAVYHAAHRRRWPVCIMAPVRRDNTLCLLIFIRGGKRCRDEQRPYIDRLLHAIQTAAARFFT